MRTQFQSRSGFAIPMVILVMFILVGALASGFTMLSGERAADDATLQAQSAAALAETGLQQGLRNRAGLGLAPVPPAGTESLRVTVAGGYTDIVTTRLRAAVGTAVPALYVVRSRGVNQRTGVVGGGNSMAMVSAFASFQNMNFTVQSSMTGINGINKAGNSGIISGVDQCPVANGGSGQTLPAVAVPSVPGFTGKTDPLVGNPQVLTLAGTAEDAADEVPFDWEAIVYDNAITPDYDVAADGTGFPSQAFFEDNPTQYPIIIVRNGPDPSTQFTLDVFGRGMLIVFGNFRLNGNSSGWEGIILVGGNLTSNGTNEVQGATITGLNYKLDLAVPDNDVTELMGTKQYMYNSCQVNNAMSGMGSLRVYQNTWANSFPAY